MSGVWWLNVIAVSGDFCDSNRDVGKDGIIIIRIIIIIIRIVPKFEKQ